MILIESIKATHEKNKDLENILKLFTKYATNIKYSLSHDCCRIMMELNGPLNDRYYYQFPSEKTSKNIIGEILYHKGQTIQTCFLAGNHSLNGAIRSLKLMLEIINNGGYITSDYEKSKNVKYV